MSGNYFSFGIYPGGQLGTPAGMTNGAPDNPDQILSALDDLQGLNKLSVRCYIVYKGREAAPEFMKFILPLTILRQNRKYFIENHRLV